MVLLSKCFATFFAHEWSFPRMGADVFEEIALLCKTFGAFGTTIGLVARVSPDMRLHRA